MLRLPTTYWKSIYRIKVNQYHSSLTTYWKSIYRIKVNQYHSSITTYWKSIYRIKVNQYHSSLTTYWKSIYRIKVNQYHSSITTYWKSIYRIKVNQYHSSLTKDSTYQNIIIKQLEWHYMKQCFCFLSIFSILLISFFIQLIHTIVLMFKVILIRSQDYQSTENKSSSII